MASYTSNNSAGLDTSFDNQHDNNNVGGTGVSPMSDDWYHGHKVVALPSSAFGGLTIREVVSSRNEKNEAAAAAAAVQRPRRSNSLGRQPLRPGRDIIQDVYDRMGVSYARGMHFESSTVTAATTTSTPTSGSSGFDQDMVIQSQPSFSEASDFGASIASSNTPSHQTGGYNTTNNNISNAGARGSNLKFKDKFNGRYRAAAAVSRSTTDRGRTGRPGSTAAAENNKNASNAKDSGSSRGRTAEPRAGDESEGQRRARSLSRGLSVQGRWPPDRDHNLEDTTAPVTPANAKTSPAHNTNRGNPMGTTVTASPTVESGTTASSWNPQQQQAPASPDRRSNTISIAGGGMNQQGLGLKRSHSFDARPQYGRGRNMHHHLSNSKSIGISNSATTNRMRLTQSSLPDEKKESDDRSAATGSESGAAEETALVAAALPSIKDRISAFAGKSTNNIPASSAARNSRRNFTKSSGSVGGASPPPPKVNIYQESRKNVNLVNNINNNVDEGFGGNFQNTDDMMTMNTYDTMSNQDYNSNMEAQDDYIQGPPELSPMPSSAVVSATAEAASKHGNTGGASSSGGNLRPSQVIPKKSQRHSTGSVRGSFIANSYLSGINSSNNNGQSSGVPASSRSCFQQQTASVASTEGPTGSMDDGGTDGNSLGAGSSASFGVGDAHNYDIYRNRKPAWNSKSNTNTASSGIPGNVNVTAEMIEKMVDERVQVQLREVEARMEGLLRRWMDQMNNKITSRLDAMEASIKDSMPNSYPTEI